MSRRERVSFAEQLAELRERMAACTAAERTAAEDLQRVSERVSRSDRPTPLAMVVDLLPVG